MQEYWSGLPFLPPGDLPDPGMVPGSPALQVEFFTTEPPGKVKVKLLSRVRIFARLLHPWDSPGKNTGVGCHFLLQGIFLTQESKVNASVYFILGLSQCGGAVPKPSSYNRRGNRHQGTFLIGLNIHIYICKLAHSIEASKEEEE